MQPPFPSPTSTWHNDSYSSISPKRLELSAEGKIVIIAGAGSGIGRETAVAFASANASQIVLLGRTKAYLEATASLLPKTVTTSIFAVDITQEKSLEQVASSVGTWDILIIASAYQPTPKPLASADIGDWWQAFETNTKGGFLGIKVFLPTANKSHATVLALTTGITGLPPSMLPGLSAYMASKLAQTKLIEFLASEQPSIFAATVHPGLVETEIFARGGGTTDALPMDKVQLPAHFLVWMSSQEAKFLNGRSVWANWDVEELKTKAATIQSGMLMTSGIVGWPYSPL
ncbi:putative NADP(+)-dependent dehydrogenase [Hypoxylon trugodes]|uniref:putative NADP(+)-dependent dehydrogenase n=1 Tax=Hypoxylon trugodes TaxID=326681 RepID=UPI0021961AD3|nr:putative NADP(+)-dependent dehydrogenase [Hypoxylon trugodes]KAI1394368.1 putative NADP(+)-dependent dehydrogenase [Hypoxylon trugodes]